MTVNNQKRRIKAPLWKEIVFQQARAHSRAPNGALLSSGFTVSAANKFNSFEQ
jgi:hypothetical protein